MSPTESAVRRRGGEIFRDLLEAVRRATNKVFLILMPAQWLCAILLARWISPHDHLLAAVILGGAITLPPVCLAWKRSSSAQTRHAVAVGQMLMSALLIHLSDHRIETHFHIFGSLAILAFYRDSAVMLTAVLIAVAVALARPLGIVEHAGWVMFETLPLMYLIRQSQAEVRERADRQAEFELLSREFEVKVAERTRQLQEANERAAADREAAKEIELMKERHHLHNQFLANVSHDLRTPITAIKGYAETLRQGGLEDTKRRMSFIRTIEKNAERLSVLVENMLDLTMLDGLKVQPLPAVIPLSDCLTELADDFGPQARRKLVRIEVRAAEQLNVRADAGHVWQVLQNLLSNAVKFSPRGGAISVAARRDGERIEILVSDEGPGVPPDELELIFKRFHSDARGHKMSEGSGLGLAIARTLAELNGGTLAAHRAEGKGAHFTFALPAAPPPLSLPLALPYN